jgi:heme exporter protein D
MESKYLAVCFVLLIGMSFVCGSGIGASVISSENGFRVDTIFLKNMIKQGDSVSSNLKISNTGDVVKSFWLRIEDFDGVVDLSETIFEIGAGESMDIEVVFRGSVMKPGVYVGRLVVEAGEEEVIPIVLEIQSENVLFATNLEVGGEYKEVIQGGDVSVSTRLFNLNDTFLHDVEMSYFIKSFNGDTIVSDVETAVVGAEVSISKTVTLPLDVEAGDYAFIVVSRFEDSVSTSSSLFSVVEAESSWFSFLMGGYGYFILVVVILLAVILVLIVYLIYERNKVFREMRRQNRAELRKCVKGLGRRKSKKKRKRAKGKR